MLQLKCLFINESSNSEFPVCYASRVFALSLPLPTIKWRKGQPVFWRNTCPDHLQGRWVDVGTLRLLFSCRSDGGCPSGEVRHYMMSSVRMSKGGCRSSFGKEGLQNILPLIGRRLVASAPRFCSLGTPAIFPGLLSRLLSACSHALSHGYRIVPRSFCWLSSARCLGVESGIFSGRLFPPVVKALASSGLHVLFVSRSPERNLILRCPKHGLLLGFSLRGKSRSDFRPPPVAAFAGMFTRFCCL